MQSLENICPEILELVRKETGKTKRKIKVNMKNKNYPIDKNFTCPFCDYNNSSRIYGGTGLFFCFKCNEKRNVNELRFKELKGGKKENEKKMEKTC